VLNGNLSTRPFYNDRLVGLGIAAVAVLVVLLTGYNGWKLVTLSRERRDYTARIDRDAAEAARLRASARATEASLNGRTLSTLAGSAHEANDLIDARTFSWTAFFSLVEKTLPIDARLAAVSPRVERGTFKVVMTVIAKDLADVDAFCDALRDTGAFADVAPTDQHMQDDGSVAATIESAYLAPGAPKAPPPAETKGAGRPPRS
jgi:hypothetical protein